ncbi:MAG TPA: polyphosphate:AMP phosphotransferase [Usitatibacter sp.]|jgi:polyphosphate:AMP phosphotransferase|nr:polyphosphate:AMP phosphotransferase [Usitatibacter sp.]
MFEVAETGHKLRASVYKRRAPKARERLLALQYELLRKRSCAVLVLMHGVEGAGRSETMNLLNAWMDPRHIRTHAFGPDDAAPRGRPAMWPYWLALPPRGRIGIFFGSWYGEPLEARAYRHLDDAALELRLERIRHFERMLAAEGALIVKLWFHLSRSAQEKRLEALASDPATSWRVTREQWYQQKHYDRYRAAGEAVLRETSTAEAPWEIIDGSDEEYRNLAAAAIVGDALAARLAGKRRRISPAPPPPAAPIDRRTLLASLDYSRRIDEDDYQAKLAKHQGQVNRRMRSHAIRKRAVVVVFEGMDAAGKGSTIRRITAALDARQYSVIPVAAPTDEERAQPYLWRFWRHLPGPGRMAIFDRSWYGRVLVERVEGLAPPADWMRAYHEINDFEEQLVEADAIVVKFWLAITPAEQLRRFRARERTPYKRYKITPEDWRNRRKWPAYEEAVSDMIERTSTDMARWHVVAADDKKLARVEVLKTLARALRR